MEPSGLVTKVKIQNLLPQVSLYPFRSNILVLGDKLPVPTSLGSHRKSLSPPLPTLYTRLSFCLDFPFSRLTGWSMLVDINSFPNFKFYQIMKLKNWQVADEINQSLEIRISVDPGVETVELKVKEIERQGNSYLAEV